MSRAMIRCPETGGMIYTGVDLGWGEVAASRFIGETLPCRRCGSVHAWNENDIELDEGGCGD